MKSLMMLVWDERDTSKSDDLPCPAMGFYKAQGEPSEARIKPLQGLTRAIQLGMMTKISF